VPFIEKQAGTLKLMSELFFSENQLIDTSAFDLQAVPDRSYHIVDPVPDEVADVTMVENHHLNFVRSECDELSDWYVYIVPYLVGHNTTGELLFVVVHTETSGGCFYINEKGEIHGDGTGHSYLVVCPADAEASLRADCTNLEREVVDKWILEANAKMDNQKQQKEKEYFDQVMQVFCKIKPEVANDEAFKAELFEICSR
jgi:hypothetical protein